MKIALTGRDGQIARSIIEAAAGTDIQITTLARPDFDLANSVGLRSYILQTRPDVIVSAAAYTSVDKAEIELDLAFKVNAQAPAELAAAALALSIPIVHISTDYVFNGAKDSPYDESDATAPLGVYGASKLAGELQIQAITPDHAILRTAWVYGPFGQNFAKTMLRVAKTRAEIAVVDDQIGNPSSSLDLAYAILAVARNLTRSQSADLRGIFHLAGGGQCSWAEFAQAIFDRSRALEGPVARIRPIPTRDYPTPATRPANSRLDCAKIADRHAIAMPHWQDSMQIIVDRLLKSAV
jgi:dTDP-4-dehydrorhamnose reductase